MLDKEEESHTGLPRDRVAQVYLGMLDWGITGDILHRRIDWMVEQAQGPRVLDVGCSEGILELLLARRAVQVTGVDRNAEALDFAGELLAREPEEVRERVQLVHADLLDSQLAADSFDTLVLGEILEHQQDPAPLLAGSLALLRPEGRVIITMPFGYHPHEDYHHTFCLSDFIALLKPCCALESLDVEDGYIRFAGRLSNNPGESWERLDAPAIVSITETALVGFQKRLYENMGRVGAEARRLRQQLGRLQRQFDASEEERERLQQQFRQGQGEVRVLRQRLQTTRSSISFLAGSALVAAAKQPWKLLGLPWEMWCIYRTARPGGRNRTANGTPAGTPDRAAPSPPHEPVEPLSFPPLDIPKPLGDGPTVAAILDTFSEYCLRYEANLVLLTRDGWRDQMEQSQPAFLLVESAWLGNDGEWSNLITRYDPLKASPLRELLRYCRQREIPTVFWNKEDPPNFDSFIDAAGEFDFVFTSDADCIPFYREKLGHDRIYVLPFAAQPKLHNPSREVEWSRHPVCFGGSWVGHRYPERAEALGSLLDAALPLGLHIFDRNLDRSDFGPLAPDYRFPDRYRNAIKGTLSYAEMLTAYRCYDVMLNANSVTESPTMFSRRVLESLACGTPVISTESAGMRQMLGDHVRVAGSLEEATHHLEELLQDEEARAREGHLAYRYIHENHTYRHRMGEVLRRIGLESPASSGTSVSVVIPTKRPENVAHCLENFAKQTHREKELLLVLNNAEFDVDSIRRQAASIPNVSVLHIEGPTTIGDCLNRGIEVASGQYVARMDDDDVYGERYLSDMLLAANFSGAEINGKGTYYTQFWSRRMTALMGKAPDHTFATFVSGATMLIRRDLARQIPFESISLREDMNFLAAALQVGCRIYSADRFNFVRVRHQQTSAHSDPTPDSVFLRQCRDLKPGLDLSRAII